MKKANRISSASLTRRIAFVVWALMGDVGTPHLLSASMACLWCMITPYTAQASASETDRKNAECRPPPSGSVAPVNIGFTITHAHVAPDADLRCASSGPAAGIAGNDALIAHYDDPVQRSHVLGTLRTLHDAGASVVRTVFWIRHSEDAAMARAAEAKDPLGLMAARDGLLPQRYPANLALFSRDVRDAGYKQLTIVIGAQGAPNPKCGAHGVYGVCYDRGFDQLTWSAAAQMIAAVRKEGLSDLEVVFDVAPETCFVSDPSSLIEQNLEHYARYMSDRYRERFADNKFFISCGGGISTRNARMISDTLALLEQMNPRPALFDIHLYLSNSEDLRQALLNSDAAARRLGIPLVVGETFADLTVLFELTRQMRGEGQLGSLQDIIVWPLRRGSKCSIGLDSQAVLGWILPAMNEKAEGNRCAR